MPSLTRPPFLAVLPNRVRRNYTGGALLETWSGQATGVDDARPEDWIASTTAAVNPGLPAVEGEGLTRIQFLDQSTGVLAHVLRNEPAYYFGEDHFHHWGAELGFLAKLLDSSIRLHVQAHPTAAFAQQHLGSRFGKFEAYVILGFREGTAPALRLGFQRAPSRAEWRRIIENQELAAMDACFEEIPLKVGDVWCVPGGLPHAIGAGVLMLEIMEPSDLVVRCEFERAGIVVPPEGRFMGRGLDFCLDVFDYQSRTVEEIQRTCRIKPRPVGDGGEEELVGPEQTPCFEVRRQIVATPTSLHCNSLEVLLAIAGRGTLQADSLSAPIERSARFLIPAGQDHVVVSPLPGQPIELLKIRPGPACFP